MSDGAHLLVPCATSADAGCQEALRGLSLPALEQLLARLVPDPDDIGEAHSLSMPHERVMARAHGLFVGDGLVPWAAWQQRERGHDPGADAWARITPCHWRVATDHITMSHPQDLQLDAVESQALLAAMQPFFAQDGLTLTDEAPTRWLARGELLRALPTASLDRVIGRVVDDWIPRGASARPLRRLQQEMQMLMYTHEINEARVRGGQLPINSFWISGAGALPSGMAAAGTAPRLMPDLREAALRADWPAWAAAWRELDARQCTALLAAHHRGQPVRITLCGERSARTWAPPSRGLWTRVSGIFRRTSLTQALHDL